MHNRRQVEIAELSLLANVVLCGVRILSVETWDRPHPVAKQPGTIREVYECWERLEHEPVVSAWPTLLAFLGYYSEVAQALPSQ